MDISTAVEYNKMCQKFIPNIEIAFLLHICVCRLFLNPVWVCQLLLRHSNSCKPTSYSLRTTKLQTFYITSRYCNLLGFFERLCDANITVASFYVSQQW